MKPRAEDVIAFVEEHWSRACARCAIELLGHDAVLSLFLGFGEAPHCARCLAEVHGREPREFLENAAQNVRRLECYRAGWSHADRRLGARGAWPEERIPAALRMDRTAADAAPAARPVGAVAAFAEARERYDAGDQACGELVLALRIHLARLAPDTLLHLTAQDLGAREDLPAWCRLTGHRLVRAEPPEYLISRRTDPQENPS